MVVVWQVLIRGARPEYMCGAHWCDFTPEISAAIEQAWHSGNRLRWTDPNSETGYDLSPGEGIQRNEQTGVCRAIRRVLVENPVPAV